MGQKGFFIIRPFNNRTVIKLNGNFDSNNVYWLNKAMLMSESFHNKYLEIDMMDVQNINIKAMSSLNDTLKRLNKNGMRTKITGFNEALLH